MKKKRILILSQSFYPDHSGIANYSNDYAFYCAESGHDVHVVTGFPFYPYWKKRDEDKGVFFRKDFYNGITIHRGYIYVPKKVTTITRILHELSLVLFTLVNSLRLKNPDVIVVFTTPILLGVVGTIVKIIHNCKLIINVQDFQIEAALSLGMLREGLVIQLFKKIELWTYRNADYVSSISFSMVDLLKTRKKIAEDKIIFWPNWTNINAQITQLPLKGEFRKKHAINDNIKIIGYAGNIGKKQGLELLIDLADQFKKNNDVCFFIIGDGAGLQQLKEYNNNKKLSNTIFLPFLNNNEYNTFLVDANAVFIPQLKVPFDIYFPSKLLGIMVSKTPIIVSADPDSELYRTVYENHLGFVSIYGSLTSLINHLNEIISNSPFTNLCTENAYAFVQKYDREIVLRRTNNLY